LEYLRARRVFCSTRRIVVPLSAMRAMASKMSATRRGAMPSEGS
jgi:hypothetical protein